MSAVVFHSFWFIWKWKSASKISVCSLERMETSLKTLSSFKSDPAVVLIHFDNKLWFVVDFKTLWPLGRPPSAPEGVTAARNCQGGRKQSRGLKLELVLVSQLRLWIDGAGIKREETLLFPLLHRALLQSQIISATVVWMLGSLTFDLLSVGCLLGLRFILLRLNVWKMPGKSSSILFSTTQALYVHFLLVFSRVTINMYIVWWNLQIFKVVYLWAFIKTEMRKCSLIEKWTN